MSRIDPPTEVLAIRSALVHATVQHPLRWGRHVEALCGRRYEEVTILGPVPTAKLTCSACRLAVLQYANRVRNAVQRYRQRNEERAGQDV